MNTDVHLITQGTSWTSVIDVITHQVLDLLQFFESNVVP